MWRLSWKESDSEFVVKDSFVDKYLLRMIKKSLNEDISKNLGSIGKNIKSYAVMQNKNPNFNQN